MSKPLVLIVEDDEHQSQIFAKTLESDFDTKVALDGNTARQLLTQIKPVIIVLDLNLPGLSGKNVLADIRANPALKDARVFLCTADASQANILRDDADIVLLKPVSPIQLRELAKRFIKGRNESDEMG